MRISQRWVYFYVPHYNYNNYEMNNKLLYFIIFNFLFIDM